MLNIAKLFLVVSLVATTYTTNASYSKEESRKADQAFETKDYDTAFSKYSELAKVGDKFAQYRLSVMHLEGFGTQTNDIEAYAWAALASQDKTPVIEQYRDAVYLLIPEGQKEAAEKLKDDYYNNYSDPNLVRAALKETKKLLRKCTGTRIRGGAGCDRVRTASSIEIAGLAPGVGGGGSALGSGAGNFLGGGEGGGKDAMGIIGAMSSYTTPTGLGAKGDFHDPMKYTKLKNAIREMTKYLNKQGSVNVIDVSDDKEEESK